MSLLLRAWGANVTPEDLLGEGETDEEKFEAAEKRLEQYQARYGYGLGA